jgi:hopene-associated glycosyltransferase HpnB
LYELIAAAVSMVIWAYLLLARGGFWQVRRAGAPPANGSKAARVAIVVPARHEADVIARSISSLLYQSGGHWFHIFLVDDASSDGTARVACAVAEECGKQELLTVIKGEPLPDGWSGKLWAVDQGLAEARKFDPDFFLFTDADISHPPDSLSALVSIAQGGGYDLVSFMARLHCCSLAEKLLIPAFVYFFFKLYPPSWTADVRRSTAGAAGGCMLVRPEALARAGGIEAIRGEIIDDCALARAVKSSGGKLWLGLADQTVSLRPHESFAEIGRMISRTAFNQLNHSPLMLLLTVASLGITYIVPPAVLFSGSSFPAVLGACALVTMILSYVPMVRFYHLNPLWALSLPFSALFYIGATLRSAVDYWRGLGGGWKGRTQDAGVSRRGQV